MGLRSLLGWTKDLASSGQTAGRRYLEDRNYLEAERELSQAVAEADRRKFSPRKRMRLRLDLAEVQRRQAGIADPGAEGEWIRSAEVSARQAMLLATQSRDSAGYVECLDLLAT